MSNFDRNDLSNRLYIAMVNPWKENTYELDEPALRKLVQYFLTIGKGKNMGIIANPEAGELFYMTPEEKREVVKIVLEEVKGQMPVFAGVLENATNETVKLAVDMKKMGVDGLFVMPAIGAIDITTSWNPVAYPEVWLDEIKAIDDACDLPILAHPVGTPSIGFGIGIPTETTIAICNAVPNMIGWKMTYNWEGWKKVGRALKKQQPSVTVLGACASLFHEAISTDLFDGTVTGSFCYAAEPMLEHISLLKQGRNEEALALWDGGLAELQEWMYSDMSRLHLRYKVASWLRGLVPHPYMRRPMPAPNQCEIDTLVKLLRGAKLELISDEKIASLHARPELAINL
ncbi:dihydrodipicolinate synthase family protein [Pseudomonas syringae group genomosp. 3]|uniref:Dihydrodipicolinate synthetase n=1 Tax=Pseudomonas syringae pv. primulae TaxID=251707 RepID=A0A3M3XBS6_9PSED|nr:dihydrodipicolinate synthase family protein [Pseudomonas syringae group genomosp. 3]RMO67301.1 Dihydrodipicolinate synthetase [Pseudomonas syringae pv. primulae]RMU40790.1 Dihydrodipicolinate synthetase [Pseudomonas syringae pv. primulae]